MVKSFVKTVINRFRLLSDLNRGIEVLQTCALPLGHGALLFCLKNNILEDVVFSGADYGARTRHLNLGKVALYQMS